MQSNHAIEVRGWTLLSNVQPRRWHHAGHAHPYTEDHHKVLPAALVQITIVWIWGQAKGLQAAPGGRDDGLHSRVPLRAAPLPHHVFLVRLGDLKCLLCCSMKMLHTPSPWPRRFTMSCTAGCRFAQRLCHTRQDGARGKWLRKWLGTWFLFRHESEPLELSGLKPKWLRDV